MLLNFMKSRLHLPVPEISIRKHFGWLLTILLIGVFFLIAAPHPTNAQEVRDSAAFLYLIQPPSKESDSQSGFAPAMLTALVDVVDGSYVKTTNSQGTAVYTRQGGALAAVGGIQDYLYKEPSASAIVWAVDQYQQVIGMSSFYSQAAGVSPTPVVPLSNLTSNYFQGSGAEILKPVNAFWQWSTNLVYGFFIVIMIVIAFLILFRQNLGGQQVVTLANSIPSILLSLFLVTLSYPICGLFVDAVFIGSNFVQSVFLTAPGAPGNDAAFLTNTLTTKSGGDTSPNALNALQPDDPQMSIWNIWNTANVNICGNNPANGDKCDLTSLFPGSIKDPLASTGISIAAKVLDFTIGENPLFNLIISIILLQASIKILFVLLKSYFTLGFYPIIAPWVFLSAAIPNRTGNAIQGMLRTLGGATLNFIAIYAAMLFIVIIGHSSQLNGAFKDAGNLEWTPPLLGYTEDQVSGSKSIIRPLAAFALYMALPAIPEMISGLLQLPAGNAVASTISQGSQAGFKQATNLLKGVFSLGKGIPFNK